VFVVFGYMLYSFFELSFLQFLYGGFHWSVVETQQVHGLVAATGYLYLHLH
jgi:hypothetical protein